jgi:ADP-ribosylglycohydrolase
MDVRAMLLAGALGDALGAPVEFLSIGQIRNHYGPDGITEPRPAPDGVVEITDDTQMTLFTLEGLIRAAHGRRLRREWPADLTDVVTAVHGAYLRWLYTQTRQDVPAVRADGWLITNARLHHRRAPGNTCLTALRATSRPGDQLGSVTHRLNDSKGCGTVMRAAPIGLWPGDVPTVFRLAVDTAALTHSHPSGYLAAGVLAVLVRQLLHGEPLPSAITTARGQLVTWPGHQEVLASVDAAVALAGHRPTPEEIAERLGGGWVAEEALAIAVCAALVARDIPDGLRIATNHDGDADSTGAVAGNILGALFGAAALPKAWLRDLELVEVIDRMAEDARIELIPGHGCAGPDWPQRYPPETQNA